MRRKVRSSTRIGNEPTAPWAAYAVTLCSLTVHTAPDQLFSSRAAAEAWARTVARALPRDINPDSGAPRWWVLVYALPPRGRPGIDGMLAMGHCYMSLDPGGIVVKHHPILAGYGTPAAA